MLVVEAIASPSGSYCTWYGAVVLELAALTIGRVATRPVVDAEADAEASPFAIVLPLGVVERDEEVVSAGTAGLRVAEDEVAAMVCLGCQSTILRVSMSGFQALLSRWVRCEGLTG